MNEILNNFSLTAYQSHKNFNFIRIVDFNIHINLMDKEYKLKSK